MKFYVLHISPKERKCEALIKKINDPKVFEFVDISDLIPSEIEIEYLNPNLPLLEDGDPNEGLSKPSRFYFTRPIRITKRPYQDKYEIVGKYAVEYAIGKKRNIKNLFGIKLDFNSIAITSKDIPSKIVEKTPEYEDWQIELQCVNLTGNLNVLDKLKVRKFGKKDFT